MIETQILQADGQLIAADTKSIEVLNASPTINLFGESSTFVDAIFELELGSIVDPGDDTVVEWIIDWGDGAIESFTSSGTIEHTYTEGGTFSIGVDLLDEDGLHTDAGQLSVTATALKPSLIKSDFLGTTPSLQQPWYEAELHPYVEFSGWQLGSGFNGSAFDDVFSFFGSLGPTEADLAQAIEEDYYLRVYGFWCHQL